MRLSTNLGVRTFLSSLAIFAALGLVVTVEQHACAQAGGISSDDANLTDAERRDVTLRWLDRFLTESELLRKQDMDKIRAAVARMTPSQLQAWLEQTKTLRAYVEGDQWQRTKQWLKEFLKVQNIYSEKEIQQLRNDVVNADANQLLDILKRIQDQHDKMAWMHQASERNRQVSLAERGAQMQQQAAVTQSARASTGGSRPLFGSTQGQAASRYKSSKGYAPPAPMITSRQVARASVWRDATRGFGWGFGW